MLIMDNTKTAEEILIETINKIRRENRHLGTAEEIDPSNIDEYDKLFITTTVGIMEEYASPLKKTIQELEDVHVSELHIIYDLKKRIEELEADAIEVQKLYELIHFWSKESHKWRDCFVTLSRFDSSKHLFSKLLLQAEEY